MRVWSENGKQGAAGGEQTQPAPAGLTQSWISPIAAPSTLTHCRVFWGVISHGGLFLWFGYSALFSFISHPGQGLMLQAVHTKLWGRWEMLPAAALLPVFRPAPWERASGVGGCGKATGVCEAKGLYGHHTCTAAKIIDTDDCKAAAWRGTQIPLVSLVSLAGDGAIAVAGTTPGERHQKISEPGNWGSPEKAAAMLAEGVKMLLGCTNVRLCRHPHPQNNIIPPNLEYLTGKPRQGGGAGRSAGIGGCLSICRCVRFGVELLSFRGEVSPACCGGATV